MTCKYTLTDANGKEITLTGPSEFKAYLVDGGLSHLYPDGNFPWVQKEQAETVVDTVSPDSETETATVDPANPIDAFNFIMQGLNEGTVSIDEYKKGFEDAVANKDSIVAELSKRTKDDLVESFRLYMHKNEKKDYLVKKAYERILSDFYISDELLAYGMGKDSFVNAVRKNVESLTQSDLDAYAAKRKEAIAERKKEIESKLEGIKDPKTLDDFQNYMSVKVREEKLSFNDARMTLTPEQRAKYDELVAEYNRNARSYRKERDRDYVAANRAETDAEIIKTVHTRNNYDLWVVKAAERVERDIYKEWLSTAKKLGGWYSPYNKGGAIPGFQFKTEEGAQAFHQYIAKGDTEAVQEQAKARRDAYQDDKTQSTVERLNEMAVRLEESANESLNQVRKVNTARRAGMAANADAKARGQIALAKTMKNIASAISSGKANFLDRVRQKVQVEFLQGIVNSAHYSQLMDETKGNYGEYEKRKYEAPTQLAADYAEFPSYGAYRSDLANLARQLVETDGTKQLGKELLKFADDVTDSYLKFAEINIPLIGGFKTKDGEPAKFSSMKQAEASIAASGYNGKAIPFKVPNRKEIIPILSPSEAQIRGIWKGDNDKRITLKREFGDRLITALGKANRKQQKVSVPWQFERAHSDLTRLQRMGIESPAELRAALREFIDLKEQPAQEDKIKKLERSMVGRSNDGLDFFPTPQSVADEMIAAADIQEGMKVLEPSAGMGHIADQIRDTGVDPDVIELSSSRRELLEAKGHNIVANDFMDYNEGGYDRIIMNPPFSDRRDAAHVQHAYDLLKPGGRLIAIMGEGVFFGSDKKASSFMDWLDSVGGEHEKMPENTFMDKSLPVTTGVNTRMVVIEKPLSNESTDSDGLKYSKPVSVTNPYTKESLSKALEKQLDSAYGKGWFNRLLATDKFKIIDRDEAVKLVGDNALFHKVWHGSPHDHNKFDSNKIGTGEGAQMFGYGLYFTDSEDIAKFYRDKLSPKTANINLFGSKKKITVKDFRTIDGINVVKGITKIDEAINSLDSMLAVAKINPEIYSKSDIKYATQDLELLKKINKAGGINRYGKVYEVELVPSQDEYLDWDKPISEQSALVKNAIEKLQSKSASHHIDGDITGKDIYKFAGELQAADEFGEGDKGSSGLLRSLGIRGIRYSAGSLSFGSSTDANNYVIFDDNDIEIVAKYSKDGGAQAFYNPANDTTYFVADNISQDDDLKGLMLHEIGVHALQLGKNDAEFQAILKQLDALKDRNAKVKAAYDRIPKDTKPEHRLEELAAYLVSNNSNLPISKRIIAWFKNALRNIAKYVKGADRAALIKWANSIDENDVIYMANAALKSAPDTLAFDNVGRNDDVIRKAQAQTATRTEQNQTPFNIAPEEKTPAFKRWFRQSKMKRGGEPVKFYHGSQSEFTVFDKNRLATGTKHPTAGLGHFFTESRSEAQGYGANVHEVFLSIQKPYVMNSWQMPMFDSAEAATKFSNDLKAKGFDGIYLKDAKYAVVFDSNQAKLTSNENPSFADDIRYSRVSDITDAVKDSDSWNNVVSRFDDLNESAKNSVYALATQRQLVDIGKKALTSMTDYLKDRTSMNKTIETLMHHSDDVTKKWEQLVEHSNVPFMDAANKQANKEMQKRLADVMNLATVYGQDPRKEHSGDGATKGQYDEVFELYDGLNDNAKRVFDEAAKTHQSHLEKIIKLLKKQVDASNVSKEARDNMLKELDNNLQASKSIYFPLSRFGNYWLYYNQDGTQYFNMFETENELKAFKKLHPDIDIESEGVKLDNMDSIDGVSSDFLTNVSKLVDEISDPDEKTRIKDAMYQLYLKSLPDLSARKHFIHRKKTPGFHEDALRGFAKKTFHDAKLIGRLEYRNKLEQHIKDMRKAITAAGSTRSRKQITNELELLHLLQDDESAIPEDKVDAVNELREKYNEIEPNPAEQRKRIDAEVKSIENVLSMADKIGDDVFKYSRILNELQLSHDHMMNPSTSSAAVFFNSIGFINYLGFSPSAALVNTLQTPTVSLPYMGARYGFGKVTKELNKAFSEFVGNKNAEGDFSIETGLSGDDLTAFTEMHDRGILTRTRSMDLIGLSEEGVAHGTARRRLMYLSAFMFNRAEVLNREITGITAFRLAMQDPKLSNLSKEDRINRAVDYADEVINTTHGDYTQDNRSRIMRGNVRRVIFQFKQYSQLMTYLWGKAGLDAIGVTKKKIKGEPLTNEDKEAVRLILGMVAMQGSAAGLMGLPIGGFMIAAQMLADMIDDDDDPIDVEAELKKWIYDNFTDSLNINDAIARGPLTAWTGLDFKSRLNQSDMWFRTPDRELEGSYGTNYLMETLGGPIVGIAENLLDARKMIGDGHVMRGIERMLPKAVKDPLTAIRYNEEGARNFRGDLIEDINIFEAIAKAGGFNSAALSLKYDESFIKKRIQMEYKNRYNHLMDMGARARIDGDSEAWDKAWKEIQEWNKVNPEMRITRGKIIKSAKQRKKTSKKMDSGFLSDKRLKDKTDRFDFIE